MLKELFSRCRWKGHALEAVWVHHYIDTSYAMRAECTQVCLRCSLCGDVKTKSLYNVGFIPLEVLKANPKARRAPVSHLKLIK